MAYFTKVATKKGSLYAYPGHNIISSPSNFDRQYKDYKWIGRLTQDVKINYY